MATRSTSPPALFNPVLRSHFIEGRKDVLAPIGSRAFLHYLGTLHHYRCETYEKSNVGERFWYRGFSREAEYAIRILTGRKRDKSTRYYIPCHNLKDTKLAHSSCYRTYTYNGHIATTQRAYRTYSTSSPGSSPLVTCLGAGEVLR